jgi:iron-sulfur cluster assembly protein
MKNSPNVWKTLGLPTRTLFDFSGLTLGDRLGCQRVPLQEAQGPELNWAKVKAVDADCLPWPVPIFDAPAPHRMAMTQTAQTAEKGIQMTETALQHVRALQAQHGPGLCLRVGVRQGGCSGMSYMMDFEDPSNIDEKDEVYDYEGFRVVCDPKSLLYLYGLVLDYSNALIGGGFQFTNPNAAQTCGCGKSFGT